MGDRVGWARTTTTQYDNDSGRLICPIDVAPTNPAEFANLQWADRPWSTITSTLTLQS